MNQSMKEKLIQINRQLIEEANVVVASKFHASVIGSPTFVDLQKLHKWWGKVKSFGHQLGAAARPWQRTLTTDPERNTLRFVQCVLGTLEAIQDELQNDHLDSFTHVVRAETLADLLDQSRHLSDNGYHIAAGVIARAVLEEHLRTTCDTLGCTPSKGRPTINDFNQALYGIQHCSKVKMKQIDTLAAIGNKAAHNEPDLDSTDIKKLLTDLPEIMETVRP